MHLRFASHVLAVLAAAPAALAALANDVDGCAEPRVDAGTYDYIVIGTGPGGGILGTNLARAGYSVLMLEAGGDEMPRGNYDPATTWDFFAKRYPEGTPENAQYVRQTWRTPQGRYWVGLSGAPANSTVLGTYYPRGATLGGSSMINYMCTWLPGDSDWDYHAAVTGDASWGAANMQRIFERIEHNNYLAKGTPGHGFDGFFQTNQDHRIRGVPDPALQGNRVMKVFAADMGLGGADWTMSRLLTRDANERTPDRDTTQSLYGLVRHTYANSTRYSSRYYVREALADAAVGQNLTLALHALATRVLFNQSASAPGSPARATGVNFDVGTALYAADRRQAYVRTARTCKTARARREVIVSGGAFNSPQLLMLSGVGPADQLATFNISLVHALPGVGQHLMDNQEMPVVGSGSAGDGEAGVAMVRSQHAPYGNGTERDVFLMGGPGFVFRGFFPDNQTNANIQPADPPRAYGVSIVKGGTRGDRGYVRLRSASAYDVPEINFNIYTNGSADGDLLAMKDIVAWVRTVYARANITMVEPPCARPAGLAKAAGDTTAVSSPNACAADDEAWIRQNTFGHHPVATNPIGADADPMAVLDSKFRVRGVAGLRVVDASAFARIPGVFPVAPTFMISQKASDDMLAELAAGKAITPTVF